MRICGQIEFIKHRRVYFCHFLNFYIFFVVFLKTVKMLKLQFLSCKKYSEHWSTVKNCNFSKLQFFKCISTVISLHIFAVQFPIQTSDQRSRGEIQLRKIGQTPLKAHIRPNMIKTENAKYQFILAVGNDNFW